MGSAKAWYFAALGVVALSFSSSMGRGLFDRATNAVDQFRVRTMPYVAMLRMTLEQPQSTPQVQQTMAQIREMTAQVDAQRACTDAAMARIQAVKDRMEARRAARQEAAAEKADMMQDQVMSIPDGAWAQLSSFPAQAMISKKTMLANHALARVQAWKAKGRFAAPRVRVTPSQVIVEGQDGMIVAPRTKVDVSIPSFPEPPNVDDMTDPI